MKNKLEEQRQRNRAEKAEKRIAELELDRDVAWDKLKLECEDHKRIRDNHVNANKATQAENVALRKRIVKLGRERGEWGNGMVIYELRAKMQECYYMLGLFSGLGALRQVIAAHDGGGPDDGVAMVEGADDAEEWLEVWEHKLGAFTSIGCGGRHLATITRWSEYREDEDAYYWVSEWRHHG